VEKKPSLNLKVIIMTSTIKSFLLRTMRGSHRLPPAEASSSPAEASSSRGLPPSWDASANESARFPDVSSFRISASQQTQANFFKLPFEIRAAIYVEIWRTASLSQHIFFRRDAESGLLSWTHCRCISDFELDDSRQTRAQAFYDGIGGFSSLLPEATFYSPEWSHRLQSRWCDHWQCEDDMKDNQAHAKTGPRKDPFLPMLATCKRL
jgi:hypothetical protein